MRSVQFVLFFLIPFFSFSQSLLDKKISIIIQDKPLGTVLFELGKIAKVNFVYDSRLIPVDKKVTLKVVDKRLRDVLDKLIHDPTLEYVLYENQLLIKKKTNKSQISQTTKGTSGRNVSQSKSPSTQTNVVHNDSIKNSDRLNDSIKQIDSIRAQTDSVKRADSIAASNAVINKIRPAWSANVGFSIFNLNDAVSNMSNTTNSNMVQESRKQVYSYSFGLGINHSIGKLFVHSGVFYTQFRKQVDYDFTRLKSTITDSSYYSTPFIKDSIYFVLHNTDTTWYINYDSTFIQESDTTTSTYHENKTAQSTLYYIQIPIIFGYQFCLNKWTFTPKAGIVAALLTQRKGETLGADALSLVDLNTIPHSKILLSVYSGLQINFSLSKNFEIFQDVFFMKNINSMYQSEYAQSKSYSAVGASLGLCYKLK